MLISNAVGPTTRQSHPFAQMMVTKIRRLGGMLGRSMPVRDGIDTQAVGTVPGHAAGADQRLMLILHRRCRRPTRAVIGVCSSDACADPESERTYYQT